MNRCSVALCAVLTGIVTLSPTGVHADEPARPDAQARLQERDALWKEALALSSRGKAVEAIAAAQKMLAIDREVRGADHEATLRSLQLLGRLYLRAGKFVDADEALRKVSDGWEKLHQETSSDYVINLLDLGHLKRDLGHFELSESFFRRAYGIEARLGKKDLVYAQAAQALGTYFRDKGEFRRALPLLKENMAIRLKIQGKEHLGYATSLAELGGLYMRINQFEAAKPLFEEYAEIFKTQRGEFSRGYATAIYNVGVLYHYMGDLPRARRCFQQALDIDLKTIGEDHHDSAGAYRALGQLACAQGDYSEAVQFLEHARAIYQKTTNKADDRFLVLTLRALSDAHEAMDRPTEAFRFQLQAMELQQQELQKMFSISTETGMFNYLDLIVGNLEVLDALALRHQQNDPSAAAIALTWTLRRKGIIMDTICQYRELEKTLAGDLAVKNLTRSLQTARLRLAEALTAAGADEDAARQKQTGRLNEDVDRLERDLHRLVSLHRPHETQLFHRIDSDQVSRKLRAGSALVEMCRLRIKNFTAKDKESPWLPEHYFAFVLTPEGSPAARLFDLGPAAAIDKAVRAFRGKIQQAPRDLRASDEKSIEEDFRATASELYELIFAPLRQALGKATLVYLAPDGELNRIPYEALVDKEEKYLVESYRFAYLLTGRDLLRPHLVSGRGRVGSMRASSPTPAGRPVMPGSEKAAPVVRARGTVVFAGPDYDSKPEQRHDLAEEILHTKAIDQVASTRGTSELPTRGLRWHALPGAAAEAEDVTQALGSGGYGPVKTYVGASALEEVFKAIPPPRVLHIATHGFFLPDQKEKAQANDSEGLDRGGDAVSGLARLRKLQDPMLRSGIVLAGANVTGTAGSGAKVEDGWVTAGEIALMNLRGTELVVLSACETGLGDVRNGEGVYGLRHAFLFAGARTLITSLFEVPDAETREIMKRFYQHLNAGKGKLNALHEARLEMIARRRKAHEAAHPFYWASFVLVGEPD